MTTAVESWSYVFGIVPSGAQLPDEPQDADSPASGLRLIEVDGLAAIVGSPPAERPLGRAADLLAHDRVLAALVTAGTPVLPMRFGAVLTDDAAVAAELLEANYEHLLADLDRVRDRVQFTLTARYEQDPVLREVLADHPEIARLRNPGGSGDAFDRQLRLGQLVVEALQARRPRDAAVVLDELRDVAEVRVSDSSEPDVVVQAAFLVEQDSAADFEERVEQLGRRSAGRLRLRLVGPSPAYSFVGDG